MKALCDNVLAVSGKVKHTRQGPPIVFETDSRRIVRETKILSVGSQECVVESIPEYSGLMTSGGRALVVLVLVGYAHVGIDRIAVYKILHSVYDPSTDVIRAVSAWASERADLVLSDEQIFYEVRGLCYEGTKTS